MSTLENSTPLIFSKEITKLIPYTLTHLRRLEAKGQFPERIRMGANRIAWVRDEVETWIEDRINARAGGD
tara:strand:+ start:1245 stop:1454 length:210 start_codon:yes stop_codon:yes gene_type:complete